MKAPARPVAALPSGEPESHIANGTPEEDKLVEVAKAISGAFEKNSGADFLASSASAPANAALVRALSEENIMNIGKAVSAVSSTLVGALAACGGAPPSADGAKVHELRDGFSDLRGNELRADENGEIAARALARLVRACQLHPPEHGTNGPAVLCTVVIEPVRPGDAAVTVMVPAPLA